MAKVSNFIPQIWSARFLMNLERYAVFKMKANQNYYPDLSGKGDTVKIPTLSTDIAIGSYVGSTNMTASQNMAGTTQDLELTEQKFFHFFVDSLDKMQAAPNLMDEAMRKAALKIIDTQDDYMSGIFFAGKDNARKQQVTGTKTDADWVTDFFKKFALLKRQMTAANHPMTGRWAIVPPEVIERIEAYLLTNPSNTISFTPATADSTLMNGFAGRILGYDIYVSNHLKTNIIATKTYINALLGTGNDACTLAEKVPQIETYRPELRFGEAVKGLYVYGAKLTHADRLFVMEVEK